MPCKGMTNAFLCLKEVIVLMGLLWVSELGRNGLISHVCNSLIYSFHSRERSCYTLSTRSLLRPNIESQHTPL